MLIFLILMGFGATASAKIWLPNGETTNLEAVLAEVRAGDVILLGEEHGTSYQPPQHLSIIEGLQAKGLTVDLGMEFVYFPDQEPLDQWKAGKLSETDFLKAIGWGGFPFDSYRGQMQAARKVRALNAPRVLTAKIGKVGIDGLSDEEKKLLPPQFELGNPNYLERFQEVIHVTDPEKLKRYFEAQSTWDDTMAYQVCEHMKNNKDAVMVVIVGEFHVQFGGGLPDRIRKRGCLLSDSSVRTISFLRLDEDPRPRSEELLHPRYGQRADFIWTSFFSLD